MARGGPEGAPESSSYPGLRERTVDTIVCGDSNLVPSDLRAACCALNVLGGKEELRTRSLLACQAIQVSTSGVKLSLEDAVAQAKERQVPGK
jgi:hypothetical protein